MTLARLFRRSALFACVSLATAGPPARADILGPSSGNTTAASRNNPGAYSATGTINFAVYKNNGGAGSDVFGTGFGGLDSSGVTAFNTKSTTLGPGANAAFDTHAKYLYVYQLSNNGPGRMSFNAMLPVNAKDVTSFGVLQNGKTALGFTDAQGLVTGQHLASRGANNFGAQTFSGGSNSQLTGFVPNAAANLLGPGGTFKPGIANDPNALGRITLDLQGNDLLVNFPHSLKPGSTSELFYFTSNVAPTFLFGSLINDDGLVAVGQIAGPSPLGGPDPSVAPAPPALVLCLLGLAAFAAAAGLRRWCQGGETATA
jgi:hypothetical protein